MLRKIKKGLIEGKTLFQFTFLKVAGQALGMIVPLIVAKFFSPDLFGSYSLAKMIVFFFCTLLISSSQTPFIVFANAEKAKSGKINKAFSIQCVFLMFSFFVFLLIMLPLGKYVATFAKINYGDLPFLLLAFTGLTLKTFLCNLFMAMGERLKSALAELVFGFLSLVFIFVFYFFSEINLRTVFMIYPISAGIVILVFLKAVDFKLVRPFNFEKKYFCELFNFTKWVFLGATAVYFINWGDNLVLRYFVSMDEIGVYNLGYQFFKGLIIMATVSGAYFLPFLSQNIDDGAKIRDYLWRKRPLIFVVVSIFIAVLFFLIPTVFNLIYGSTYYEAVVVLRILLVGVVFRLYSTFYYVLYSAAKQYKFFQILNVIQVFINILLNLVLVPIMGIRGAAVATVIAYFLNALVFEFHFSIKMKKLLA